MGEKKKCESKSVNCNMHCLGLSVRLNFANGVYVPVADFAKA